MKMAESAALAQISEAAAEIAMVHGGAKDITAAPAGCDAVSVSAANDVSVGAGA